MVLVARRWLVALCTLVFCAGSLSADQAQAQACAKYPYLTFGILPFISTAKLVYRFAPLAEYLSIELGTEVRLETAPDFEEFARRTHQEQQYDILFTAPHFYTIASQKSGYQLVASIDAPEMWAIIVVPEDSAINTPGDLSGKRLATVHPMGLATLLVRQYLFDAGIDPDVDLMLVATPSHDASLLSAYHGVTDAAALMYPPFDATSETIKSRMKVIASTRTIPTMPVSVAPWISSTCTSEIETVLLSADLKSSEALQRNNFNGFRHAQPAEYEKIDEMLVR